MTVRCALYMDALKNFGSPWLRPQLLFPKLLMTVVVIDRMKVHQMAHVRVSQKALSYSAVKLFSKNANLYLNVTDRRTDGRTTYDRNTALCTKVHRTAKNRWIDTSLQETPRLKSASVFSALFYIFVG